MALEAGDGSTEGEVCARTQAKETGSATTCLAAPSLVGEPQREYTYLAAESSRGSSRD